MPALWRNRMSLLKQYTEASDALEWCLGNCPEALWHTSMWTVKRSDPWIWPREGVEPIPRRTEESIQVFSTFSYRAIHTVFLLDFYLSGPDLEDFASPDPFQSEPGEVLEEDGAAAFPTRTYARSEVLGYLSLCKAKAETIISALTEADTKRLIPPNHPWGGHSYNTLLRVNVKHVKEHAAQMERFLERAGAR